MNKEELKSAITGILPEATFDESGELLNVIVPSSGFLQFMTNLMSKKEFDMNYLYCLTCIDWKDHFMMVYHLLSRNHKHEFVVKVKLENRDQAEIETVCGIWKTAELLEREVFDLFGVTFLHHPDLRRLFLDEDWPGFPLRKDYVDENMIEI
ncbi:MAG: NADH-quinone oxidoreductase subunit C [Bacteroidetes bacterium]|jgi:NADH:ubiquinone oxidoreductase subunit C|nr:NADH-quinone oxidoreductase subunit C [Bacteroidota bacterium]